MIQGQVEIDERIDVIDRHQRTDRGRLKGPSPSRLEKFIVLLSPARLGRRKLGYHKKTSRLSKTRFNTLILVEMIGFDHYPNAVVYPLVIEGRVVMVISLLRVLVRSSPVIQRTHPHHIQRSPYSL